MQQGRIEHACLGSTVYVFLRWAGFLGSGDPVLRWCPGTDNRHIRSRARVDAMDDANFQIRSRRSRTETQDGTAMTQVLP